MGEFSKNANLNEHMSYDSLRFWRNNHPAWRLMAARRAPLVASFLYREFVMENKRAIPEHILESRLKSYLEMMKDTLEEDRSDEQLKTPREYLVEWADDRCGWLRRFYPSDSDEIHYDLTSEAQKAIEWLMDLKQNEFITTESRLIFVFELLQQIAEQSQTDPDKRLKDLKRQRGEIDAEIERVKRGEISVLEPAQIRERFAHAMSMAREILADFRAVEQNFRDLNRDLREKIATWDRGKGELVGAYFSDQTSIYESDQGKCFRGFMDFLNSSEKQEEFSMLTDEMHKISAISGMIKQSGMDRIAEDWLDGSYPVWKSVENMSEQLKRFVDENYIREERRINSILMEIEAKAIALKGNFPKGHFTFLDNSSPDINLPFDRKLFMPPKGLKIESVDMEYGEAEGFEEALYNHIYVNKEKLLDNIEECLKERESVTLAEITEEKPIEFGLTELLAYLSLNTKGRDIVAESDDNRTEAVRWISESNGEVVAYPPHVEYHRREKRLET